MEIINVAQLQKDIKIKNKSQSAQSGAKVKITSAPINKESGSKVDVAS